MNSFSKAFIECEASENLGQALRMKIRNGLLQKMQSNNSGIYVWWEEVLKSQTLML